MAYDTELADRLREYLATRRDVTEKAMFGGLAFLVGGHMAVAASGRGGLMVRVDPASSEELVALPHVERMVMRGRAMDGWLTVATAGVESDADLAGWAARGVAYASGLPPKG